MFVRKVYVWGAAKITKSVMPGLEPGISRGGNHVNFSIFAWIGRSSGQARG
jgi:hypothetical protein